MPPTANFPRRPLYEILRRAAAEGRRSAGRDVPAAPELTFGDLKDRVDRLASALAQRGIVKGDRIGIMLPNCPPYLIAVFAVLRLGAMVVNINPAYTAPELSFIVAGLGPPDAA